ncbi:MAG TPA: SOS response-associated peptidase family protein [Caulobacteraceae bacterium]|jgi:putative SOS response-associated peptidase YedK|nr:SOS response-associated peptidase family protein [Caulobacteraceae bacterium]
MCNRYGYNSPHHRLVEIFGQLDLPFRWPAAAPNLAPLEEIRPTDPAPVVQAFEDGVRLDQLRWGFEPPRPKAGPVINFRSEGRRFDRGRCLVPATHFFEFTGDKYPKTKWRFTHAGDDTFCFAGLVRDDRFTLLTCEPGPDVAPYHNRQPVILPKTDWAQWLDVSRPQPPLRPSPAGTLAVERQ